MPTPQIIQNALARVHDLASLVNEMLANPDVLHWPIEERIEDPQKITFGWSAEELNAQGLEKQLLDGEVRQVRPLRSGQPWGIFLVEFAHGHVYRTALRQVLRGLVPNRRRDPNLQAWRYDHLLFICTTRDYDRFTFAHFRGLDAVKLYRRKLEITQAKDRFPKGLRRHRRSLHLFLRPWNAGPPRRRASRLHRVEQVFPGRLRPEAPPIPGRARAASHDS